MAKNDIRLDINFCEHPKTKRLIRVLGFEAPFALLKLWTSAAKHYPKGVLKDLDEYDIADLTDWSGDPKQLVEALTDPKINFLEKVDGQYQLHDWEENQPWIFFQDERVEKAKKAARARWGEESESPEDAGSSTPEESGSCGEHASSIPTSNAKPTETDASSTAKVPKDDASSIPGSNAPSPTPIPIPIPIPNPIPSSCRNSDELPGAEPEEIPESMQQASTLAHLLEDLHTAEDPKFQGKPDLWAKDIEKLIRLDKRGPDEVEQVLRWAKSPGSFWFPNIISGRKLREKYPTLKAQMERDGPKQPKQKPENYYRRSAL